MATFKVFGLSETFNSYEDARSKIVDLQDHGVTEILSVAEKMASENPDLDFAVAYIQNCLNNMIAWYEHDSHAADDYCINYLITEVE